MERVDKVLAIGIVLAVSILIILGSFSFFILIHRSATSEQVSYGPIKIGGSTTVYPFVSKAAEVFMQQNPEFDITVTQSSSGEGIAKILNQQIDIADITRPPTEEEYHLAESKGMELELSTIANDAVVVVVDKNNPLKDISSEELRKVFFTGEITDWSELTDGQKTGKINIYGTDPKISGTAELFISKVYTNFERKDAYTQNIFIHSFNLIYPTPKVVEAIAKDKDSIGYTPFKWVNKDVKVLTINNIHPSKETILNGKYSLARRMMILTDGIPRGQSGKFINFLVSQKGQNIAEEEGFISALNE